jgi:Dolichyl-phosphate-mannose-protein mannosyltransferase
VSFAVPQVAPPTAGPVAVGGARRAPRPGWGLGAVLLVQAGLSVRLVWTDTAFQDEALYLRAGHLEWAHWLHHAPIPDFPAYFSGAPVAYPLLGALADSGGGLAGARLLSLAFMLGGTALLWATTTRLYGRRAALLACGLFATLAGTQFLGSLATFDAPALFLLALASWLGVRAVIGPARLAPPVAGLATPMTGPARPRLARSWLTRPRLAQSRVAQSRVAQSRVAQSRVGAVGLLAGAGLVLAAADVTKYATALYTPVVLAMVALAAGQRRPAASEDLSDAEPANQRPGGLASAAIVLVAWGAAVTAAGLAGGRDFWAGVTISTLDRPTAGSPVSAVLHDAYVWTSLVLVLAALGVWLSARGRPRSHPGGRYLPAVLLAAALLAPAVQARLHTTVSLQKHVVFGAWFAAIAAGYALARLSRVDRGYGWAAVMALPIAAATLFGSMGQAHFLHRDWPDATALVTVLRPAVAAHPGHYLAEDDDVEAYYLRTEVRWPDWSSTYYFRFPGQAPGAPSYAAAIRRHYFTLIILDDGDTAATDALIVADLQHTGGYRVLARPGRFTVWVRDQPGGGPSVDH